MRDKLIDYLTDLAFRKSGVLIPEDHDPDQAEKEQKVLDITNKYFGAEAYKIVIPGRLDDAAGLDFCDDEGVIAGDAHEKVGLLKDMDTRGLFVSDEKLRNLRYAQKLGFQHCVDVYFNLDSKVVMSADIDRLFDQSEPGFISNKSKKERGKSGVFLPPDKWDIIGSI